MLFRSGDFFYLGGAVSLSFAVTLIRGFGGEGYFKRFSYMHILLLWMGGILFATACVGKNYTHYLYQAFPPFCLFAAQLFNPLTNLSSYTINKWSIGLFLFIVVSIPIVDFIKIKALFSKPDIPQQIAKYISNNTVENDNILKTFRFSGIVANLFFPLLRQNFSA